MSIEYTVFSMNVPNDLEDAWIDEIHRLGYGCELRPGTKLLGELETGPWFKITSTPPNVKRYSPETPLLVGIGFEELELDIIREEGELHKILDKYQRAFQFRTSTGRTKFDYLMQVVGAVAFAKATGGVIEDPEAEIIAEGKFLELIDIPCTDEHACPFIEWPPEDFEEELNYKFPSGITKPNKPWWKLWS